MFRHIRTSWKRYWAIPGGFVRWFWAAVIVMVPEALVAIVIGVNSLQQVLFLVLLALVIALAILVLYFW